MGFFFVLIPLIEVTDKPESEDTKNKRCLELYTIGQILTPALHQICTNNAQKDAF